MRQHVFQTPWHTLCMVLWGLYKGSTLNFAIDKNECLPQGLFQECCDLPFCADIGLQWSCICIVLVANKTDRLSATQKNIQPWVPFWKRWLCHYSCEFFFPLCGQALPQFEKSCAGTDLCTYVVVVCEWYLWLSHQAHKMCLCVCVMKLVFPLNRMCASSHAPTRTWMACMIHTCAHTHTQIKEHCCCCVDETWLCRASVNRPDAMQNVVSCATTFASEHDTPLEITTHTLSQDQLSFPLQMKPCPWYGVRTIRWFGLWMWSEPHLL
jgi:hypothetical protein